MRVLQVIAEMGAGGAERMVADLTTELLARDVAVDVASSGGFRADQVTRHGAGLVDLSLAGRRPLGFATSVRHLHTQLRAQRADVIHTHNVKATAALAAASRLLGARHERTPVVTTVHGLAARDFGLAARVLSRTSDRVVAVSSDVRDRLVAAGLDPARTVTIPNAAPAPTPTRARSDVRRGLGIADDRLVVVCVARLEAPKRHDLLVQAWESVVASRVRAPVLLVVGDGADRARIAAAAAPLGETVRMLGERHDVADLLVAADLSVLPTDREGLPMAVLESLAAGTPVVASAVGGLLELPPGVVELVDPGSALALGLGLDKLLDDPQLRVARVTSGTQLARDRYSTSAMYGSYRSLYEAVVGAGPPRPRMGN